MNNGLRVWYFSRIGLVLMLAGLVSCAEEQLEIPDHILSKEVFARTYAEVQMFEASIKQKLLRGRDSEEEIERYFQQLFESQNCTREQFEETRNWYAAHPELLKEVVEEAMEIISTKQANLGGEDD